MPLKPSLPTLLSPASLSRALILAALTGASVFLCTESLNAETQTVLRPAKQIQELMPDDQFEKAGLDKLTPEELEQLNAWLYGYVEEERQVAAKAAIDEVVPQGEEAFGLEDVPKKVKTYFRSTPGTVESRVLGDFQGWSGRTLFRLENGQVWQQAEDGDFYYPKSRGENPIMEIRKGLFGSYILKVKGMGTTVKVKRVE